MSDLHVALITPWDRKGGIARYSERFATELEGISVIVTPVPIAGRETANPLGFTSLIDQIPEDADVIHVQFEAGVFGRFGISGIGAPAFFLKLIPVDRPVVTTLHEVHRIYSHRGPIGDYLLRIRDYVIERTALMASDVSIVHTREAEDVLRERHGQSRRIRRFLHPVDADVKSIDSAQAKQEMGLTEPVILTFGWIEEKKRYDDVIHALPALPDVTYLLAGEPRFERDEVILDRVLSLAASVGVRDRVKHIGYVPEDKLSVLFSAADAVVLPYRRVSQSGAVNDALAYHKPVVATALPAFKELEARFECLLTYEEVDGLTRTLSPALNNDRIRDDLEVAAKRYTEKVSWVNFVRTSRELYEGLVD